MTYSGFMPAEWAPQEAIIVGFPSHPDLWPGQLLLEAQQEVAALCNHLAEAQTCYVLVANTAAQATAKRLLTEQASIILFAFGDIWLRDIAPLFKTPQHALCFVHNGWGKKYCYPYDDCAATRLTQHFNIKSRTFNFVLEGGALEHNGEGDILTTRQCMLNRNRNHWSQQDAEAALKHAFNAKHIFWLDEGLAFDHTDGHIDNSARFVNHNTVLCQKPNGNNDPNTALYQQHEQEIVQQNLHYMSIPSPGKITDTQGDIMPASHVNFVIGNHQVIFPHYLKDACADKHSVDITKEVLTEIFPEKDIISSPSNAILTGGGSFHCISQHIPR